MSERAEKILRNAADHFNAVRLGALDAPEQDLIEAAKLLGYTIQTRAGCLWAILQSRTRP
jgi:hypothetical protein